MIDSDENKIEASDDKLDPVDLMWANRKQPPERKSWTNKQKAIYLIAKIIFYISIAALFMYFY